MSGDYRYTGSVTAMINGLNWESLQHSRRRAKAILNNNKLRIFVNYALKTPEYECLSNFSRITYCCHFSAFARGFVLFRIYESRSGDAEFRVPGREKPGPDANNFLPKIPSDAYFSGWASVKSPKMSLLTSCDTRWSYLE